MAADTSIQGYATQMRTTEDLNIRAAIYASVASDTEGFTKNMPEGSEAAIRTIQTLGRQAIKTLEWQNSLRGRTLSFIPNHPQISAFALSILSGTVLAFANNISPILGASTGALAYTGGRLLLGRCLNRQASKRDERVAPKPSGTSSSSTTAAVADPSRSAALATHRPATPQLEKSTVKQNPRAAANTYQVLISLLLDPSVLSSPSKMPLAKWLSDGTRLYTIVTQRLHLTNEDPIDIGDIKRLNLLNSEIFLNPRALKPRNDLHILRNEEDLTKLLDDFNNQCKDQPIAAILTRPPHTLGIFYNPLNRTFIFFDPQENEGLQQFSIFRSIRQVVQHLTKLKPIAEEFANKAEFYTNLNIS